MLQVNQSAREKQFSELTKKERRALRLEKHYDSLQRLYDLCGGGQFTGKKLSSKLLVLEQKAHRLTTMQCNGEGDWEENERQLNELLDVVSILFNRKLNGLFINGDARGYALKIKDSTMREEYSETQLHKDWGGYGILAPEINGNY